MNCICVFAIAFSVILAPLRPLAASKVVARVGTQTVTERMLMLRVQTLLPQISFHRRLTPALKKKLRKLALKQMIEEALFIVAAKRRKLVPADAAIEKTRARQIKRFGGKKKFGAQLKKLGLTWSEHWQLLRRRMAAEAVLMQVVVKPSRVDDASLAAYYAKYHFKFKRPPAAKLLELLFVVKPGSPEALWKKAAGEAAQVIKALRGGADARKLAATLAHGKKTRVRVKDLGWVHRGRLGKALDTPAFALRKNQVSAPVRTLRGYVVLRCAGRRTAQQLTFAQAKGKLRGELFKKGVDRRRAELLRRVRAQVKVSVVP